MPIKRKQERGLRVYGKRRRQLPASQTTNTSMFFPPTNEIDTSQQPPPLPPNKPAFNMTVDPDEETINNLISFCTGVGNPISRADAIRYLKAKNNNIEEAFQAHFGGEDISHAEQARTWDESVWSQGKEGVAAGGNDGDPNLRPLLSSAAPTRANSPNPGNRSNLQPSSKAEEDEDMARAMAMSQGNEYFSPPHQQQQQQESGIVGHGGQETQFGPANRNDYNPRNWAMVPAGPSTTGEVVPDAEVEERVGKKGEPRMLKPVAGGVQGGEYVANLLTVLANVYGAREAMLMRDAVKGDYGQDGEWWKGGTISMPKIVALGDGDEGRLGGEGDPEGELVAEVQRLMAFLSASERSYGSAGALMHTEAIWNASPRSVRSNTMLELFMQTWAVAARAKAGEENDLAGLFTTTVGTNASEGMDSTDMTLIDMPIDASPDDARPQELLELLDGLLWDTSEPEVTSDNYIERPAEVLVMRLRQRMGANGHGQLKVSVPAEFYVDKYMREHIESTRATRAEMAKGKKKVEKIERIEAKLRTWKNPKDGREIDASKLIHHTRKYIEDEQKRSATINNDTENDEESALNHTDLTSKLTALLTSIDTKFAALAEEKEKTLAAVTAMSRAPVPGVEKPEDQEYRYILRGVATKPNITYVLAHEAEDSPASSPDERADHAEHVDTFDDADDTTYPGMRWWRLEYEVLPSGLGAKVSKVRVGDYDVLRAVELEHESAMLVYGSIDINSPPAPEELLPLPHPLQEFVRRDNEIFAAEVRGERTKAPPAYASFDMMDDNNIDNGNYHGGDAGAEKRTSMDSTRAEGPSLPPSPPDYGEVGGDFERHPSFGLGPAGMKSGYVGGGVDGVGEEEEEAPVAEIRLDDDEGLDMSGEEAGREGERRREAEMVETGREGLLSGVGKGLGGVSGESDVEMAEVSQRKE